MAAVAAAQATGQEGIPFIVIGRHQFTPRQKKLLEMAGFGSEVARVPQVDDVRKVVELAQKLGVKAIVVQALPLPLLMQLLQVAKRAGIDVYTFKIQALKLVPASEKCPPDADIEVPSPDGKTKRCSKTVALERVERIEVVTTPVATLP